MEAEHTVSNETLEITLTEGAIKNGYISIPTNTTFFPVDVIGDESDANLAKFTLNLPDGSTERTFILEKYGRIRRRFTSLFHNLKPGTKAILRKISNYDYELTLSNSDKSSSLKAISPKSITTNSSRTENMPEMNQILFGPPGTGKTFETTSLAVKIAEPEWHDEIQNEIDDDEKRKLIREKYDQLLSEQRIVFSTFHQSFSYEDFVEGIRAETNSEQQIEYSIQPGIFKRICDDATTISSKEHTGIRRNPRVWKISINGTWNSPTKSYCLEHGEARIGWGETGNLEENPESKDYFNQLGSGDKGTLKYFAEEVAIGDIFVCIRSADLIEAIGVVTSDYRFEDTTPAGIITNYQHVRSVDWLYRDVNLSILPLNDDKQFTLKTVYALDRFSWADLLAYLTKNDKKAEGGRQFNEVRKPYVLIIDEINRGNISRIFGELITLIEPSKREGQSEALTVTLPYSKKPFSVPDNLYIIGTMNTADKSLAQMDLALRRRFSFVEMMPKPELLRGVEVYGIDLAALLTRLNQRIEALLDPEHLIGHSYFLPLKELEAESDRRQALAELFKDKLLPLLQEYFFDDFERIGWVLNDPNKPEGCRFIEAGSIVNNNDNASLVALFSPDISQQLIDRRYRINTNAFYDEAAYTGIL